jgi:hypothetical protein
LAEASRRNVTAVSTDNSAGYGIILTSSGTESAAKGSADIESTGDLLNFLFTQKAGAHPAKHAICFHKILLSLTFQQVIISRMRKEEAFLIEEELAR